jgi:glucose/mannose-6-phosphate isomerase
MDLDNIRLYETIDTTRMIELIDNLPAAVQKAWQSGRDFQVLIPAGISQVVFTGTGVSYFTADLLASFLEDSVSIPAHACLPLRIPAGVKGENALVIITGVTGDEPELIRALTHCVERKCRCVVAASGGRLLDEAARQSIPFIQFEFSGPSRLALAETFYVPLAVLNTAGITRISDADIAGVAAELAKTRDCIHIQTPVVSNPAKRLAGQFLNRLVTLFASGWMTGVAYLWKLQIHGNAKAWAQVEEVSTAARSTVGGMYAPEAPLSQMMTIFLESPFDVPDYLAASGKIRELFMVEGFNTDYYVPGGDNPLKAMWNAILFGLFVSYYLAIAYGIDPLPNPGVEEMEYFFSEM